jgi:hypothetical protein
MNGLDRRRALALLGLIGTAGLARSYDLPGINLGLTSFLDGVLPSGPGLYYQHYVEYYTASRFDDIHGSRLPLPGEDLALWADINQLTYFFHDTIGPGRLALNIVIPDIVSARTNDGLGGAVLGAQSGLGDITLGAIYEFNPVMLSEHQSLHQSLEFDILAPTGRYNPGLAVNPGNNFWALNPFYSVTFFASERVTFSGRFYYLYSHTNDRPPLSFGSGARTVQAGQAFHVNFDAAYAFTPRLWLGLNGYFLKQFTDTRVNREDVSGRNERVLGLGPGATYQVNKDTFLFFNAYAEMLVRNRTEGEKFLIRLVHHF